MRKLISSRANSGLSNKKKINYDKYFYAMKINFIIKYPRSTLLLLGGVINFHSNVSRLEVSNDFIKLAVGWYI